MAALLLLAGCGEDAPPSSVQGVSVAESEQPCVPAPAWSGQVPGLGIAVPPGSVVTDVQEQAGQRLVTARVPLDVGPVLQHFREVAEDAGLVVQRDEDEGRAGRLLLFGIDGDIGVTAARLGCPPGSTLFTVQQATRSAPVAATPSAVAAPTPTPTP